jgi:glycosyltransferase involved in cell wall biosynthesis
MIEAMACGSPVIAYNRGSVPEIIDEGLTGFIVEDETSAVAAVGRLPNLNREAIRKQFETRFLRFGFAVFFAPLLSFATCAGSDFPAVFKLAPF